MRQRINEPWQNSRADMDIRCGTVYGVECLTTVFRWRESRSRRGYRRKGEEDEEEAKVTPTMKGRERDGRSKYTPVTLYIGAFSENTTRGTQTRGKTIPISNTTMHTKRACKRGVGRPRHARASVSGQNHNHFTRNLSSQGARCP